MDPQYTWDGNRLTGHGTLFWNVDENGGNTTRTAKFESTRDFFQQINGNWYAVYPDFEAKVTGGLRFGLEVGEVGLDVNFFSAELYRYSFAEGHRSIIDGFKDLKKLKVEQGLGVEAFGANAELSAEYNVAMTEMIYKANIEAGGYQLEAAYDAMADEVSSYVGFKVELPKAKLGAAFFVGADINVGTQVVRVPHNDINAFMKGGKE
jgi:hypothetical protein